MVQHIRQNVHRDEFDAAVGAGIGGAASVARAAVDFRAADRGYRKCSKEGVREALDINTE
jgi:hypothetical protein